MGVYGSSVRSKVLTQPSPPSCYRKSPDVFRVLINYIVRAVALTTSPSSLLWLVVALSYCMQRELPLVHFHVVHCVLTCVVREFRQDSVVCPAEAPCLHLYLMMLHPCPHRSYITHTCTHTNPNKHIHTYPCKQSQTHMHANTHTQTHTCKYAHKYTQTRMRKHTHTEREREVDSRERER